MFHDTYSSALQAGQQKKFQWVKLSSLISGIQNIGLFMSLINAYFPQAVSTGDVVRFGERGVVEHSRPEVVDRSPLAHHHLRGTQPR